MLWKAPEAVVGLGGGRIWVSRVVVENMSGLAEESGHSESMLG